MQSCQHGTKRTALIEIRSMRRPAVRSRDIRSTAMWRPVRHARPAKCLRSALADRFLRTPIQIAPSGADRVARF